MKTARVVVSMVDGFILTNSNMDIKEILARDPEALLAMSDAELQALLSPFFPAVRQAVMPPEKATKIDARLVPTRTGRVGV